MSLNMDSILAKAKKTVAPGGSAHKRFQTTANAIVFGTVKSESGANIHTPEEVAEKFIQVLKAAIAGSGISANAQEAISSLAFTAPQMISDNTYRIGVYFNENLSRPSLDEARYGGITDLAELFDQGMTTKSGRPVHGLWHGKETWSRTTIPGAGFMDAAVTDFLSNYASEYNVISCTVDRSFG